MKSTLDEIADETKGKSLKTYKYYFEGIDVPKMDYDDHKQQITWKNYGETEHHTTAIPLKAKADSIISMPPLFAYFLDGSRRAYKVNDMSYANKVYPIIAGQVGVGCCIRVDGTMMPLIYKDRPMYQRDLVISLPKTAKSNGWVTDELAFEHLRKKLNQNHILSKRKIEFAKIMAYSTSVDVGDRIENKGIATIQDYMVEREKEMVAELVKFGFLLPNKFAERWFS